jgi:hypothetical protein
MTVAKPVPLRMQASGRPIADAPAAFDQTEAFTGGHLDANPFPLQSCPKICSCEWQVDDEFLFSRLFPERHTIKIEPGGTAEAIVSQLPEGTTHFAFQLNCTNTSRFIKSRDVLLRFLSDRGITVINGHVQDISKRKLQEICVSQGLHSTLAAESGHPDELLMVKTNLNAGGVIERKRGHRSIREHLAAGEDSPLLNSFLQRFKEYPVLARREVPVACWGDHQLIVENFIHNDDDRFYRVHVLFDMATVTEAICLGTTKKLGETATRTKTTCHRFGADEPGFEETAVGGVLREIRLIQEQLRFDFAGIDVVVNNSGVPFVVDVNTTPFSGLTLPGNPVVEHLIRAIN